MVMMVEMIGENSSQGKLLWVVGVVRGEIMVIKIVVAMITPLMMMMVRML